MHWKKSHRDLLVIINIAATYILLSSTAFSTGMAGDQSRVLNCLSAQERSKEEGGIVSSCCVCMLDYTKENTDFSSVFNNSGNITELQNEFSLPHVL